MDEEVVFGGKAEAAVRADNRHLDIAGLLSGGDQPVLTPQISAILAQAESMNAGALGLIKATSQ